jgi:hypothetical protein
MRASRLLCSLIVLTMAVISSCPLLAQVSPSLSGTVSDSAGKPVSGATISAKSVETGQTNAAESDTSGHFSLPVTSSGQYELSVSAPGFAAKIQTISLPAATLNITLAQASPGQPGTLPNAPSSSQTAPSLSDLGFPSEQTQSNAKEQALLDKRTHMLKIHQKLGLITAAPMIATVVTSLGAGGKKTSNTDRTVHMVLGSVTSDLYFTSAYFAIRAPGIKGTPTRGPIKLHKALAWIHGPGMILTPILGALAYNQKNNGEHVHGLASAHGPVAIVTAGAFGAALLSVSLKF